MALHPTPAGALAPPESVPIVPGENRLVLPLNSMNSDCAFSRRTSDPVSASTSCTVRSLPIEAAGIGWVGQHPAYRSRAPHRHREQDGPIRVQRHAMVLIPMP